MVSGIAWSLFVSIWCNVCGSTDLRKTSLKPGAIYNFLLRIAAHYNEQDPDLGRNIKK